MAMFQGYAHMVDFFTSFDWWRMEPHDELVNNGAFCLAKPGELYAVYLPHGGNVSVHIEPGTYDATWWDAGTGRQIPLTPIRATNAQWTSPAAPGDDDWALLLKKQNAAP